MLGKRSRSVIGKLSGLLVSGSRGGFSESNPSPRSPLDLKSQIHSPRGPKGYDLGGVGLGIVAALEKSGDSASEILLLPKSCVSSPGAVRPGSSPDGSGGPQRGSGGEMMVLDDDLELEDYTYVTFHGPNQSFTMVYCDGVCFSGCSDKNGGLSESIRGVRSKEEDEEEDEVVVFPTLEFLNSCQLCGKKLHGEDIYMYRGERAFCSTECRSTQVMMEERKEQCRSEAPRRADISSSAYCEGQIFSTGILAI